MNETEPSIDFWDEYYAEVREEPSIGTIVARRARQACNNLTDEEREEYLARALERIHAKK